MRRNTRMTNEVKQLKDRPVKGISCWPVEDNLCHLEACLIGQDDTPYCGGIFKLDITVPERYPFEPPQVRFTTPIFHPNIDTAGRICLDILKMPPKGAWKPVHNISTVLKSIQMLMAEPNPDDPLMAEIAEEFKSNKVKFIENAKKWTTQYAKERSNSLTTKESSYEEKNGEKEEENQTSKDMQHLNDGPQLNDGPPRKKCR